MDTVYYVCEVLVAITAVTGNGLVLIAFFREKRLRRRTNYYIVSLAVADLLVGLLGIPCALLAYIGLPKQLHACLFTLSLLVVLCTISIFSLVAVSVDRYWAILYPMGYSRNVRTKTAICIICGCWVAGMIVGFLPLFGWNAAELKNSELEACIFTEVMDYNFLVFIYLATIIFPGLLMAAFYAHIYTVVVKQLRQMVTVNGTTGGSGAMLRVLGAARKREVKATQNLSVIVLFFMICWFPLYTINFIKAFKPDFPIPVVMNDIFIILTHLNSAGNPLLYAYHLRDFRAALRSLLIGSPEPVKKKTGGKDNSAYLHDNEIGGVIDHKLPPNTKQIHNTAMIKLNKNKQIIRMISPDKFELTPKTPHRIFNLPIDSTMEIIKNGISITKESKSINKEKETILNRNTLEKESNLNEENILEPQIEKIMKTSLESPLEFVDEACNDINNEVYSLGGRPTTPIKMMTDNLNNNNSTMNKCNCTKDNNNYKENYDKNDKKLIEKENYLHFKNQSNSNCVCSISQGDNKIADKIAITNESNKINDDNNISTINSSLSSPAIIINDCDIIKNKITKLDSDKSNNDVSENDLVHNNLNKEKSPSCISLTPTLVASELTDTSYVDDNEIIDKKSDKNDAISIEISTDIPEEQTLSIDSTDIRKNNDENSSVEFRKLSNCDEELSIEDNSDEKITCIYNNRTINKCDNLINRTNSSDNIVSTISDNNDKLKIDDSSLRTSQNNSDILMCSVNNKQSDKQKSDNNCMLHSVVSDNSDKIILKNHDNVLNIASNYSVHDNNPDISLECSSHDKNLCSKLNSCDNCLDKSCSCTKILD